MTKKSYHITYEKVVVAKSEKEVEKNISDLIFFATECLSANDFSVECIDEMNNTPEKE